jgi:hypothetical protein
MSLSGGQLGTSPNSEPQQKYGAKAKKSAGEHYQPWLSDGIIAAEEVCIDRVRQLFFKKVGASLLTGC